MAGPPAGERLIFGFIWLNGGLTVAGFWAFVLYLVVLSLYAKRLYMPFPTLFVMMGMALGYAFYMVVANLIYLGVGGLGLVLSRGLNGSFASTQRQMDRKQPWYRSIWFYAGAPFVALPLALPLLTFLTALDEGPYRPVSSSEVPGRYIAQFGDKPRVLVIRPNGAYQLVGQMGERKTLSQGRWIFEEMGVAGNDHPRIILKNVESSDIDPYQSFRGRSSMALDAIHLSGTVRLCGGDFDAPDCYEKEDSLVASLLVSPNDELVHPSRGSFSSSSGGRP